MEKEEQLRNAIKNLDEETAKDALALVLANKNISQTNTSNVKDFSNFAQAIIWLKNKYNFKELESFSTEADLVYVNTGDRKILLTDKNAVQSNTNTDSNEPSIAETEDVFEPLQKNGRFSNLEL